MTRPTGIYCCRRDSDGATTTLAYDADLRAWLMPSGRKYPVLPTGWSVSGRCVEFVEPSDYLLMCPSVIDAPLAPKSPIRLSVETRLGTQP